MKHHLLTAAVMIAAVTVSAQNYRVSRSPVTKVDRAAELAARRNADVNEATNSLMHGSGSIVNNASQARPASPPTVFTWGLLCGSMNAYGQLGTNQRALQYNPALNALSFIHRKSISYNETPAVPNTAKAGVIIAEISTNLGTSWDSTCIWSNDLEWGRYPQGGIYNPSGNTSIANAYVIGTGPTVNATDFSGTYFASKQLGTYNTTASSVAGAQQFYSFNLTTYPPNMPRHGWTRNGFQATNDGVVHALGILGDDPKQTQTMRGYAVVTGTFNGTTFDYKIDSIIPNAIMKPDGISKHLMEGQMIWNPAGTIGYVVGIGVRAGATLANRSYQPIVYKIDKTLSSSATWSLMQQLDFNTTFTTIPYHLPGHPVRYPVVNGDTTAIPFTSEFDANIDANNNLHIGILFMSGASDHPDSLAFYSTYKSIINPTENYRWQHLPGERPYIYDFIGDGVAPWKMVVVDSMSSEAPDPRVGSAGYNENPWDPSGSGSSKLEVESRLQIGRTPDGQYMSFSWAESDTAFTNGQLKFNSLPELKCRLMALSSNSSTYVMDMGPEVNVSGNDPNVRAKATLHFMSQMTGAATVYTNITSSYTVDLMVPFTVTNSNPYSQLTNNATWFCKNTLSFKFAQPSTVGIRENNLLMNSSNIYPNPANGSAMLVFALEGSTPMDINFTNMMGQVVRTVHIEAAGGENRVNLDLSGLSQGIYLVDMKTNSGTVSKKLVIE